jgi:hypothetical protein
MSERINIVLSMTFEAEYLGGAIVRHIWSYSGGIVLNLDTLAIRRNEIFIPHNLSAQDYLVEQVNF